MLQLWGDGPVRWLTTAIFHTATTIAISLGAPTYSSMQMGRGERRRRGRKERQSGGEEANGKEEKRLRNMVEVTEDESEKDTFVIVCLLVRWCEQATETNLIWSTAVLLLSFLSCFLCFSSSITLWYQDSPTPWLRGYLSIIHTNISCSQSIMYLIIHSLWWCCYLFRSSQGLGSMSLSQLEILGWEKPASNEMKSVLTLQPVFFPMIQWAYF